MANTYRIGVLIAAGIIAISIVLSFPAPGHAQKIRTLSVGVGKADRGSHRDYSLRLIFATQRGNYLADIDVSIISSGGKKVVDTHASGPWLFVDLPAGEYRVTAIRKKTGARTAEDITVPGGKQKTFYLTWPEKS